MNSKYIKIIAIVMLFSTLFSCSKSDIYTNEPVGIKTYELTPTVTVSSVSTTAPSTATAYTTDDTIEAYVTSNDAAGNFYKSISFQTIPTDGSSPVGFSVSVDKAMLFTDGFTPGRKVYIKLKGLAYGKIFGSLLLGVLDSTSSTGISGISELDFKNYLFPSATIVDESTMVRQMSLATALNNSNLNTLIEITNTSFADNSLARTYFDVDNGGYATNHTLIDNTIGDITPSTNKYCRISQYAPFSVGNVPSGRGIIRGVMTKYNSDFQFLVRQESDFKLTGDRTYTFNSTLNENFSTAVSNQVSFPKYLNFATVGTKKWKIYSGAIEMSSYGGTVENNKAYFLIPVNMDNVNTFKFDLKAGFYTNGLGLKIYRTTDYVPGMKISNATLIDITSYFTLPTGSTTSFASAGTYNLPANITGNGYFVFEYTGTSYSTGPALTTTIDIDNIVIN